MLASPFSRRKTTIGDKDSEIAWSVQSSIIPKLRSACSTVLITFVGGEETSCVPLLPASGRAAEQQLLKVDRTPLHKIKLPNPTKQLVERQILSTACFVKGMSRRQ